eukprot:CAMPEP_0195087744 /NCGR_PEP_ID=MMETSP0448-20130528/27502_1 /TAXON_ID=66468 /ORGANISM="Heterocapsa triquestra, Strain CCMP 448" /LENGTH=394 /DNA_ID=CAMNT_0040121337 /DNA_START=115 /DNA_END=1296 /DNA_ORIENTATION=+
MAVGAEVKSLHSAASELIVKHQQQQAAAALAQQGAVADDYLADGAVSTATEGNEGGAPTQLQPGLFPPEEQLQPGLFPQEPPATCAGVPADAELLLPSRAAAPLPHDDVSEEDFDDIPSETSSAEHDDVDDERRSACESSGEASCEAAAETRFTAEETVLIFDWDDTILPSSWVQRHGLRLDEASEVLDWQLEQLAEVASVAAETLRIAKQFGTVVLVTNAERGWIELSCQKFMPQLMPLLETVRIVSARTSYKSAVCVSPIDWKLRAFEAEIRRLYGLALLEPEPRKNILSLGDSVHEREALMQATSSLPNCRSKSLKFVERPDITQICKQHALVAAASIASSTTTATSTFASDAHELHPMHLVRDESRQLARAAPPPHLLVHRGRPGDWGAP